MNESIARDACGTIDDNINYTILPFDPGELSTIQVPNWYRDYIPASSTKPFNFADLPCPPKDVMVSAAKLQTFDRLFKNFIALLNGT